jgi:hypothetical protein
MVLTLKLKDSYWQNGLKNKIQIFAVYKKITSLAKTHTQAQSERMEYNIPNKQNPKASQSGYTHIQQNRLQDKN